MTLTDRQFQLSRVQRLIMLALDSHIRRFAPSRRSDFSQRGNYDTVIQSQYSRSTVHLVFKARFCLLSICDLFSFHRRKNPMLSFLFQRNKLRPSLLPRINAFAVKRALNRARMDLSSNYLHLNFLSLAQPFGPLVLDCSYPRASRHKVQWGLQTILGTLAVPTV